MKKVLYICMLAGSMLFSGCSDWLDVLPKNEQVTANYWKAKEDVEAVLASGYYYMREATPLLIDWGELRAGSVYMYIGYEEQYKLMDFQLISSSNLCKWETFYKIINMANSVITYAPDVEEKDETYSNAAMLSHQTEAYFMRALTYFYLVRNFKEVPLVLQPYVDDSAPYSIAKASEETLIAQIKADINMALESGAAKEFYDDDKWAGASKGRATKWALYALMADVCLWSEDYEGCVKYADYLINATAARRPAFMSVPEQWFSIFNPGNSNESIFELNWDKTLGQTSKSPSNYFKVSVVADYQFSPTMLTRLIEEKNEVEMQIKNPIRSAYGAYALYGLESSEGRQGVIWKYNGTEVADITAVRTTSDANLIIYRMTDVLLMKAEALIWQGSGHWADALAIINKVRVRANLKELDVNLSETDELEMLELLLNERDIEFAAELKRWYDLVRFGKSKSYKYKEQFITKIAEENSSANDSWIRSVLKNPYAWYLPIHNNEIEVNAALVQNPYYGVTN
ncbi:hypothetical protein GGR06_002069 [Bacteroides reticulotermitis]|uniref:RagB/SusD family nutrient uptake outer membrane protein n=1 Tax=Bacteroides reticulotermitis TaxID=1133319 RepID=A0A840D1K7_9BACE|nr:RagB/SusD family nutrient uptake outer membrane protein [Bacteroides reticulotermitis]MBB4044278.1 hypothetical protein [Bacteroides reticulotermitis]